MATNCLPNTDEMEAPACHDTFPEVAFFEVPNELGSSKSVSNKSRELVKHPAFKEISAINGQINRMTLKALRVELEKLSINSCGTKDVLRKRLKFDERKRILSSYELVDPNTPKQHYTHLLVIDFEATCEEHQTKDYVHEIIEFPAVLVRVEDVAVVAEFHRLVRPVLNPILTPFCRDLTAIPQSGVESAACFPEVLQEFEQWLVEQGVSSSDADTKFAVATDGPWDMARFLLMQCSVSKLPFPSWARSWINLRKVFSNFYVTKRLCLSEMLSALGLEFQGRPHCGLDDARNIAAIAEVLLRDGAAPRVNETIAHLPRYTPPTLKGSSVASVTLKEFETSERRKRNKATTAASNTAVVSELCTSVTHLQLPDDQNNTSAASSVLGVGNANVPNQHNAHDTQNNPLTSARLVSDAAAADDEVAATVTLSQGTVDASSILDLHGVTGINHYTDEGQQSGLDNLNSGDAGSMLQHQQQYAQNYPRTHPHRNTENNQTYSQTHSDDGIMTTTCCPTAFQKTCPTSDLKEESSYCIATRGTTDGNICINSQIILPTSNTQSNSRQVSSLANNQFTSNGKSSICTNGVSSDCSPSDNDSSTSQENMLINDEWIKSMPYLNIVRSEDGGVESYSFRTDTSRPTESVTRINKKTNKNKHNAKDMLQRPTRTNNSNANDRDFSHNKQHSSEHLEKPVRRTNRQAKARTGRGSQSSATKSAPTVEAKATVAVIVDFSDTKEFPVLGSSKRGFR
uniref:3'-5' exoribonuclease 1-like n=1 Tax=Hirondellea gigas TaxID=1518452 RepID=A0A6A7G0P3_9CRUS